MKPNGCSNQMEADGGSGKCSSTPVFLLRGQEWCWVERIAVLLDGDWYWISIFWVSSVFLITATLSEEMGAIDKSRETQQQAAREHDAEPQLNCAGLLRLQMYK